MDHPKISLLKLNIKSIVAAIILGVIVASALYVVQNSSVPAAVKLQPFLGITYSSNQEGAYIKKVTVGSAAEKAGLRAGDIVTKIDGQNVDSASKISQTIATKKVGDSLSLTILANGQEMSVTAILQEGSK